MQVAYEDIDDMPAPAPSVVALSADANANAVAMTDDEPLASPAFVPGAVPLASPAFVPGAVPGAVPGPESESESEEAGILLSGSLARPFTTAAGKRGVLLSPTHANHIDKQRWHDLHTFRLPYDSCWRPCAVPSLLRRAEIDEQMQSQMQSQMHEQMQSQWQSKDIGAMSTIVTNLRSRVLTIKTAIRGSSRDAPRYNVAGYVATFSLAAPLAAPLATPPGELGALGELSTDLPCSTQSWFDRVVRDAAVAGGIEVGTSSSSSSSSSNAVVGVYWFVYDHSRGHGYALAAAEHELKWAKSAGVVCAVAVIDDANPRAAALALKLGFLPTADVTSAVHASVAVHDPVAPGSACKEACKDYEAYDEEVRSRFGERTTLWVCTL